MDGNPTAAADLDLAARLQAIKPALLEAFHSFHQKALERGALEPKTKELIALAAAHLTGSPCCIEAHAQGAQAAGATEEEIVEAIFIASAMSAGAPLARSAQALQALKASPPTCCPAPASEPADQIRSQVREYYATRVQDEKKGSCCGPSADGALRKGLAHAIGYREEDLSALPSDAVQHAFGCGNPLAFAQVKEGEVVLDLGSGAGIDVLLASKKVGPTGKVIGLDMTPEMIEKAHRNTLEAGATNVEFRLGHLEAMPIEDQSVDWIISNCVINLSPDKERVFREAFRVLKPGGRLLISDIVTRDLSPETKQLLAFAWSCCLGGALEEEEYLGAMRRAGLTEIQILESAGAGAYLAQGILGNLGEGLSPEQRAAVESLQEGRSDQVVSLRVSAVKPTALNQVQDRLCGCSLGGGGEVPVARIREEVQKHYTRLAHMEVDPSRVGRGLAESVGYPREVLDRLPDSTVEAFSGTGCPLSLLSLREGQVVLDLASGPGLDSLLAAERVGPTGRVIGLDMTPAMLERAEVNRRKLGRENVEFRQGYVEEIPLEDGSVDVVTSNGALNLSPHKGQVLREAFRVLKPGGVLVVSDVFLARELPADVKGNIDAWAT
ncbi:MAG: arsenite methyltransferase [Candidatus Tectomicrobia bacterium]|uniref:Arsenite methyltransferase n=1 Tax=Tectimicrobiota bacterium TaxID=2528274 RepID=A0A932FX61_UNCTE|nr:arsenite methyltransferase [Candidatus Tectomicrobia bacterium]